MNIYAFTTPGTSIPPNIPTYEGIIKQFTVEPNLPDGLVLDPITGVISGTPSQVAPQKGYTVIGCNAAGCTYGSINIRIIGDPPILSVNTNSINMGKIYVSDNCTPHSASFEISNIGFSSMDWRIRISDNGGVEGGISFSPEFGFDLEAIDPSVEITVEVNHDLLNEGIYTAQLEVYSITPDTANSPFYVNLTVDIKKWKGAEIILPETVDLISGPGVEVNQLGHLIISYTRQDTTNKLFSNFFDGTSWLGETLHYDGGTDSLYPTNQILNNSDQMAVMVVINEFPPPANIQVDRYEGGSWSGMEIVDLDNGNIAMSGINNYSFQMDGSGNILVGFNQNDGSYDRGYANFYNGTTWEGPTIIDAGTGENVYWKGPLIRMNQSGKAVAIINQSDGSYNRLYANHFDGANWSGTQIIDAGTGLNADSPDVILDNMNRAWVLFRQNDGSILRCYLNYYNGSTWTGAQVIDSLSGNTPTNLHIVNDGSGNGIITFFEGTASKLWMTTYSEDIFQACTVFGDTSGQLQMNSNGIAVFTTASEIFIYDGSTWLPPITGFDACNGNPLLNYSLVLTEQNDIHAIFSQYHDPVSSNVIWMNTLSGW